MEELINYLLSIGPLKPAVLKRLRKIIRVTYYKAGDLILARGAICRQIFFIRVGLVRSYHMVDDNDVSHWFMKEGDICISVDSFFNQVPSREYHVALEDCECWSISRDELEETYRLHESFNLHGRKICQHYYSLLDTRMMELARQTTQRKYELLLEKNPDFIGRISNKHMASYLNVALRTYQKMKREYLDR